MSARDGAAQNRLDGAAFLFAYREVHRRIHRAGQRQQNDEVRHQPAQELAADLLGRGDVGLLDAEGLNDRGRKLARRQPVADGAFAQIVEK